MDREINILIRDALVVQILFLLQQPLEVVEDFTE